MSRLIAFVRVGFFVAAFVFPVIRSSAGDWSDLQNISSNRDPTWWATGAVGCFDGDHVWRALWAPTSVDVANPFHIDLPRELFVSETHDGEHWSEPVNLSIPPPGTESPYLFGYAAAAHKDTSLVVFLTNDQVPVYDVYNKLVVSRWEATTGKWSVPIPLVDQTGTPLPMKSVISLACDGAGTWMLTGYTATDSSDAFVISRSLDDGVTWEPARTFCQPPILDRIKVVGDGKGTWLSAIVSSYDDKHQVVAIKRSTNNGATWSDPHFLTPMPIGICDADYGSDYSPSLSTDKRGHWVIAWGRNTCNVYPNPILYAYSDDGVTWSEPAVLVQAEENGGPAVAADSAGTWVISWTAYQNHAGLASRSFDNGTTWTTPETVYVGTAMDPAVSPVSHFLAGARDGTWVDVTNSDFVVSCMVPWFSTAHLPVRESADLAISISESTDTVTEGSTVGFVCDAANAGPLTAPDATIDVDLPPQLEYVPSANPAVSFDEQTRRLTFALGDLVSGTTVSVGWACQATSQSVVSIRAIVSSNETDPIIENNVAVTTLTIEPQSAADLAGTWMPIVRGRSNIVSMANATRPSRQVTIRTPGIEISNLGPSPSTACSVAYYLSTDATFDADDILLRRDSLSALPVGQTITEGVTLTYAGRSVRGKYVIAVVDADGNCRDEDRSNNVTVLGPLNSRR